ncbi:uncharacterized protein LOC132277957 [Cornus florida]|uniref:uncharacterized protein LOC132277957 n=1 Tax=Cornus florida TaxID=4283 RepID=UPI0028A18A1D|nr:uncharacterized protein LOC132277957 [Cornus florida]
MKSNGGKVNWEAVCKPKAKGGLGLPNLEISNRAAVLRYIWDLHTDNTDRIWLNWCRIHLIKGKNLWSLKIPHSYSWSWRKILQLRHQARHFIKHLIGDGNDTSFWLDNWSSGGPLCLRFSPSILSSSGIHEHTKVSHFIGNNSWSFPPHLSLAIPELLSLQQPVPFRKDKLIWLVSPSGSFSLKYTIFHLSHHGPAVHPENEIYHMVGCSRQTPNS